MTTETITRHPSPTVMRLLDDELAFSPSFRRIYSNHLAMALAALDNMGATPDVLQAVFDAHDSSEAERRDDRDVLDRRLHEVTRDGIATTVRTRAADLVDGVGTALFHPVIRLGYALDLAHPGQVAAALLDWERRKETLPVPVPSRGTRRLVDVGADLAAAPPGAWRPTFDLDGIARRPELRVALEGVARDAHTLDDVSSFAIASHLAADDFITLHLVTGARAVRTVISWLEHDDAERLAAHTLPVMAVAYAAVGAPPLLTAGEVDVLRAVALPTEAEITALAIGDRDPHVIKLAEAALAEHRRTADPLYLFAAARAVGLVPPAREAIRR